MQRVFDIWKEESPLPTSTSSIYLLGREFSFPQSDISRTDGPAIEWPAGFRNSVKHLIWFMYRTQFPTPIPRDPLGPSPLLQNVNVFFRSGPSAIQTSNLLDAFSSDVGWGCMIRTGQSLLANALVRMQLSSAVKLATESDQHSRVATLELLREFRDEPEAMYSIHRFVQHGARHCDKLPGEWFGPSAVATCIAEFAAPKLSTYISSGMDVYECQLASLQFPVLVLCNLRLGISEINPIYYEGLRSLLTAPYSVGIAGGRTSASHYFYGVQDTNLFYHDPHEPKSALTSSSSELEYETVHSDRLRILHFKEMDPSMLAGFLLQSSEDLQKWKQHINSIGERERVLNITELPPPDSLTDANFEGDSDDELANDSKLALAKDRESDGYVVCSGRSLESAAEPVESIEAREPSDETITVVETAKSSNSQGKE